MTRHFAPPTTALATQIRDGWRADESPDGRWLKNIGVEGRRELAARIDRAAHGESRMGTGNA